MATAFKQVVNNAQSLVATAPSTPTAGTSLVVTAGQGARFPTPGNSFWATIWGAVANPDPSNDVNREIVLVTAVSTDTFTITRAQQSTSARTVVVGDAIRLLWTAGSANDIHTAVNALENISSQKQVYEAVVAASGGDYTTVSAALAAGKGSIFVRRGTYAETAAGLNGYTLTSKDLTIIGEDRDNTILTLSNGTTGYFETLYPTLVSNLTIQCGTAALTNSTDGWVRVNASDATFRDVVIIGGNTAVNGANMVIGQSGSLSRTKVEDCWLKASNSGGCLQIGFSSRYTHIVNNRMETAIGSAFSFQNQDNFYLNVRGNHFLVSSGSGNCMNLSASTHTAYHAVFADNYCEHAPSSNTPAIKISTSVDWWSNFIGNTVRVTGSTNGYCLDVASLSSSTFTGNTFYSASAGLSSNSGLVEIGNCVSMTFTGNQIHLASGASAVTSRKGLISNTNTYCTFTGNNFSNIAGTSNIAINLLGTNVEVSFDGNVFQNCTSNINDGSFQARTRTQTELAIAGGISLNMLTKTANYTLNRADYAILCSTNAFTVTLPSAVTVGAGKEYTVSGGPNATVNNITIATTSSQTIDGSAPGSLTLNYMKLKVISDGANWFTIT